MPPKPSVDQLGAREREIMNAIFALGNRASAEDVRARLTRPPSSSTVRVMLSRLERKGFVRHTEDGLRYIYSATVSPTSAKKRALREYLQTFFGGSLAEMVAALVQEGPLTDEELAELTARIERVRKQKR
jgi:predicted transcriptional regulator